jgi:hypothetical protein
MASMVRRHAAIPDDNCDFETIDAFYPSRTVFGNVQAVVAGVKATQAQACNCKHA